MYKRQAEQIIAVTGSTSRIALTPYEEAYATGFEDMYRRVPDIAKLQAFTGWSPTRSLEDIITDVVADQRRAEHAA